MVIRLHVTDNTSVARRARHIQLISSSYTDFPFSSTSLATNLPLALIRCYLVSFSFSNSHSYVFYGDNLSTARLVGSDFGDIGIGIQVARVM